jgi:hypothetical protein
MRDMEVAIEIAGLERALAIVLPSNERHTMETLVAPDFRLVGIRSTGHSEMSLSAWIETARDMRFHRFEIEVKGVDAFGDAAIATVDAYWRVDWLGQRLDERALWTDVWIKRDNAWRLVRRHSSPYQPAALPLAS